MRGLLCEEKGNEGPLLTAGSIEPLHGPGNVRMRG